MRYDSPKLGIWKSYTTGLHRAGHMSCAAVVATQHVGLSIRNYPSNKFKLNCEPIWCYLKDVQISLPKTERKAETL